jgi:hypothetical protein
MVKHFNTKDMSNTETSIIVHTETKDGLTVEIVREREDENLVHGENNYWSIMGGDSSNPSWNEYMENYTEEYKAHFELLKQAIINAGWVGKTGEEVCNYHYYRFSDGLKISFSWRAWGDLMQAIVNKREGYMTYYM